MNENEINQNSKQIQRIEIGKAKQVARREKSKATEKLIGKANYNK